MKTTGGTLTQADRRARSRSALLEAAARGLSQHGYANLVLERVASEAGYTRGALYHLFANKEELVLAATAWVEETWWTEVGPLADDEPEPVAALIALARGHAVFCRRDVARVIMTLRIEFAGQDHPIGREAERVSSRVVAECTRLIKAGRGDGSIPPGPPPRTLALAILGAIEGAMITVAGQVPHDEVVAERLILGVLGLIAGGSQARPASGFHERRISK